MNSDHARQNGNTNPQVSLNGRASGTHSRPDRGRRLGRSIALFQFAAELPAALLARMLGIHIDVARQRASRGDWMTYAADVSRHEPNLPKPSPPPQT
jgi:hypothetical protein